MLISEEQGEINEKEKMFMEYIRYYVWHFSNAILLTYTLLREIFIQQVQPTSESKWRYKEKGLICLLISLRVVKSASNLTVNSCWSYTENGPSSTIIALIPIDMHHQD